MNGAPPPLSRRRLRALVAALPDPELPMISIGDLGILRDLRIESGSVEVEITPTYSGCPAMEAIRADVEALLHREGVAEARVRTVLAPAWSTDWMSEAGRRKLHQAGIAPPGAVVPRSGLLPVPLRSVASCPRCGAPDTDETSRFGPTACTSLRRCPRCGEPFEHFKAH